MSGGELHMIEDFDDRKWIENDTQSVNNDEFSSSNTRLYKKRWVMLLLFSCVSFTNAYQWIHLNIVSDRVEFVWNSSLPESQTMRDVAISWLSMIYMASYVPFIIPAMWFLEHYGLRVTSIIACFLNAAGAWIKCFTVNSNGSGFQLLMVGQSICGIAQIFILGIPSHLAALWFGLNEVSTATALAVFGNQLGIGFGLLIPSVIVPPLRNTTSREVYETRFRVMLYSGASVMTVLFVLVCIFFKSRPKIPPSLGQMLILSQPKTIDFRQSFRAIGKNMNFVLLIVSYGINTGIFYAFSTIMNSMLIRFFKEDHVLIGAAGFVLVLSGVVSAVLIGIVLDRTKQFKRIIFITYICSLLSMCAFSGGLYLKSWPVVFLTCLLLGFFMTGYLPIGFEIAAEMTYPLNEGLTSGLINLAAQLLGVTYTYAGTVILQQYGVLLTNLCFIISLIGGAVLTGVMQVEHRRQEANLVGSEIQVLEDTILEKRSYDTNQNPEPS